VVAQSILEEGPEAGRRVLTRMKEVFEPGSLYVELQDHGLPEQPILNGILVDLACALDLPLVATNDVHYAEKEDAEAHLYLSCIKTGRSYAEAKERHHGSSEMYLKSQDEMARTFSAWPEAIANTMAIAEKCSGLKLKLGEPMLPSFKVPEGYDTDGYFHHVAREGLEKRFQDFEAAGKTVDREAYRKRLAWEADVIAKMKFPGYFLIVWDFIRYAKENGIPVGPAAAPAPARSSRTRCGSPTSIPSPTTSSSSASSTPSASRCRTSTSTSAWTGATRSSPTSRRSTARRASGRSRRLPS
jgi:DNA polymerase-3 subunit alpha